MLKRLIVELNEKPCYDLVFSLSFAGLLEELQDFDIKKRCLCIVTDSKVDSLYGGELCALLEGHCRKLIKFVFPEGEQSKTLDTVKELYQRLIEEKFDRRDLLLALGGGVVGDLTGFAAATYLRGVDFIQIPTTLLAQADSSIGGKTGVDFDGYKNMVGAFKMPKLVYMNLAVLRTLDDRQYYSGFAEVMKHGIIQNEDFYEWLLDHHEDICSRELPVLEEMLVRSCRVKKNVVEKDPTEQWLRAILNMGHTIGHAVEKARNFSLYHGECVALGTIAAAYISWRRGWLPEEEYLEIRDMFFAFHLPITVDGICPEEILAFTKGDKKMDAGVIKFILLKSLGNAVIDTSVTDQEILEAVKSIMPFEEGNIYEE